MDPCQIRTMPMGPTFGPSLRLFYASSSPSPFFPLFFPSPALYTIRQHSNSLDQTCDIPPNHLHCHLGVTADSSSEEEGQVIEETTSSPQSPVASTKPPLTQKRRGTLRLRLPARSNLPSSSSSPQTSSSSPPSMTTSPASTSLFAQ